VATAEMEQLHLLIPLLQPLSLILSVRSMALPINQFVIRLSDILIDKSNSTTNEANLEKDPSESDWGQ
jgi:hypothetical protein